MGNLEEAKKTDRAYLIQMLTLGGTLLALWGGYIGWDVYERAKSNNAYDNAEITQAQYSWLEGWSKEFPKCPNTRELILEAVKDGKVARGEYDEISAKFQACEKNSPAEDAKRKQGFESLRKALSNPS